MKKKTLLMVALCTATLTLVACGSKETTTDATTPETSAPTQSVTDDVTDTTVTKPTATETPAVTEPTVAPVEPDTEVPTPTPTEAPTPTEVPTPTEAPKELSKGEQMLKQYTENYPFIEYEILENVIVDCGMIDAYTEYVFCIKNNGNEPYMTRSSYVINPGTTCYMGIAKDFIETNDYDGALYAGLKFYGEVYPTTDTSKYLREDELQLCEDENCLVVSCNDYTATNAYNSIIFYNAENKAVYCLWGRKLSELATNVDNQIHVDISRIGDVEWATAKIVYEVTE